MLYIYYGEKDVIRSISSYFDVNYEDSWITEEFSKRAIKGIDKSDVLYPHVIMSPVLGPITPKELSGGVKEVILMAFDKGLEGEYFFGEQLGDNTLPYVLEIAENKDIHIAANHFLKFPKDTSNKIMVENTGRIVTSYKEFLEEYFEVM